MKIISSLTIVSEPTLLPCMSRNATVYLFKEGVRADEWFTVMSFPGTIGAPLGQPTLTILDCLWKNEEVEGEKKLTAKERRIAD